MVLRQKGFGGNRMKVKVEVQRKITFAMNEEEWDTLLTGLSRLAHDPDNGNGRMLAGRMYEQLMDATVVQPID